MDGTGGLRLGRGALALYWGLTCVSIGTRVVRGSERVHTLGHNGKGYPIL